MHKTDRELALPFALQFANLCSTVENIRRDSDSEAGVQEWVSGAP